MSLFKHISGRSGEDIATEIVSYMLASRQEYIPFQKLFFNRILNIPASSTQLQVETTTQPSFAFGRPDFIILTQNALIVVETKLGAYLHGDNQLIRYCEVFKNVEILRGYFPLIEPHKISKKSLVFLAPHTTIDLSLSISNKLCKREYGKDFELWCKQQGIEFMPLSWEEILTDIDDRNSLQNELLLFVNDFINQELNAEEIMILKNANIPSALIKIFNTVADIRDYLYSKDIKPGRLGQSYNFYGFII